MAPQDSYLEDEEETCPLCIEEFDLTDRNFRPCPCGYQVCQFCYNNIKTNMNGLCPACRRAYDDQNVQWKVVTSEEYTEFRNSIQRNRKKRAQEQRQKEAQKREAEKENRKNLVGVRVVQKNLVYVTGLAPTSREDEILKTLRRPEFFGQYGNIQKISISHRKSSDGQPQSMGVYVTFEKNEEASRCIQAVHGSTNGDRVLRAQLGTTKYCSAWLRHETCTNRQCMFLHELGDEEDSFTRQDLSSINGIISQVSAKQSSINTAGPPRASSRQQSVPAPAPQPATLPSAAVAPPAAQPMARSSSKEGSENGGGDLSALPSSASWARNPQRSRRGSHATSGAASSPAISTSLPVTAEAVFEPTVESPIADKAVLVSDEKRPTKERTSTGTQLNPGNDTSRSLHMKALFEELNRCPDLWLFQKKAPDQDSQPPKFNLALVERRRVAAREDEEEARIGVEQEEQVSEPPDQSEGEPEESGSLALGGEPESSTQDRPRDPFGRVSGQPPIQRADSMFGPSISTGYSAQSGVGSIGSRTMTPQQQAFLRSQSAFADHLHPSISAQSNLFQHQGHVRQGSSRFNFSGETGGAASVKVAANPRIMAQQSAMMPPAFHGQPSGQYYSGSVAGPPPGLKSTGTPPNLFAGQGHVLGASAFGNSSKDSDALLHSLVRGRAANSHSHDAGKHLADPSILQARMHQQSQSSAGVGQGLFSGQAQGGYNPNVMYNPSYPRW